MEHFVGRSRICFVRATCFSVTGDNQEGQFPRCHIQQGERHHPGLGAMTCAGDIVQHCADRCHYAKGEGTLQPPPPPARPPLSLSQSTRSRG